VCFGLSTALLTEFVFELLAWQIAKRSGGSEEREKESAMGDGELLYEEQAGRGGS